MTCISSHREIISLSQFPIPMKDLGIEDIAKMNKEYCATARAEVREFFEKVKNEYPTDTYLKFLKLFQMFSRNELPGLDFIRRVSALFQENRELILGMNAFLSNSSFKVEFPADGPPLLVYCSSNITHSILLSPTDGNTTNTVLDDLSHPGSSNSEIEEPKQHQEVTGQSHQLQQEEGKKESEQPKEEGGQAAQLQQGSIDKGLECTKRGMLSNTSGLLPPRKKRQLPLLSPGQKQAPSPAEFGNAIGYVLSIKSRFSDKPGIYENFLAILQDYRNEKMGTTDVVDCLSSLFEDHPDLLKGFACFCPDSHAKERLEVAVKDLERRLPVKSLKQTEKDSNGQQSSGLGTEEGQSTSGSGAEDQSPPAGTLTQENPPVDSNTHTATGDFTIEYQLYSPSVQLDDMVIPEETKKRVFETISSSEDVKRKYYGQAIKCTNHGLGQVLLFYGYSGTGKTMLANAVATKLNKQILAVNFPNLDNRSAGPIIQALFKEARNKSAVLFFDECEFLGQDRTGGSSAINILGAELEQLDGLCILATNRPQELDEAIRRRISLAIEFRKPNPKMREELWKTLKPSAAQLDDNVCLGMLAKKYEVTGGHIKNAWFQSLCIISQQGRDKITQEDLMQAASEQVTEQLSVGRIDRHVTPTHGLESVVLPPAVKESLSSIVQYTKAQSVLFGKWGFDKMHRSTSGISALFTGLPGTGKSMAAEAIGFDLERPLLFVNVAQLVSMWAGETGKNIEAAFADAKKMDAVLVFDEAEGLFGSRSESSEDCSRHDNMNVGLLLQYIENHPGVVIVITNMKNAIDNAFFRRFRFVLDFEMPDVSQREDLWKTLLPPECPLDSDVSLRELASRYAMCGGDIKNSIMRAATRAALRSDEEDRKVTMSDLTSACEAEMLKKGADRKTNLAMYS